VRAFADQSVDHALLDRPVDPALLDNSVKWEKNDSRTSLTSLSLMGIMHAKQFVQIKMIKRQSFA
jgi:hypothetical protein